MIRPAHLTVIAAAILAAGCGSEPTATTGTAGAAGNTTSTSSAAGNAGSAGSGAAGTGGAPACPDQDEAHLFVDGAEVAPLKVIGGGGAGTPPTEVAPDEASLILSSLSASGEEREAFLYLRGLVVGSGVSLASSSAEYRVYAPSDGGAQPPIIDTMYSGTNLTGALDVAKIAAQPGDVICGTFDLEGKGTPAIRITGGFHHVLAPPGPGN